MNLELMIDRLDAGLYLTTEDFLVDVRLIVNNALDYNPPTGTSSYRARLLVVGCCEQQASGCVLQNRVGRRFGGWPKRFWTKPTT
jgi:hypothetical protein